jgi:hypothetical protein
MAGEYDVPVWTASQANRSALEEDIIEADKISESYNKVMIADFVLSLSRKIKDKLAGTGRFHVIKNRFGPDGINLPSKINTNIDVQTVNILSPNFKGIIWNYLIKYCRTLQFI